MPKETKNLRGLSWEFLVIILLSLTAIISTSMKPLYTYMLLKEPLPEEANYSTSHLEHYWTLSIISGIISILLVLLLQGLIIVINNDGN